MGKEEKRYWWLQMEHDFFEQKEMKALKRMSAGYVYTTIYLKLLLKSLKNNGSLYFESIEDDFVSEIAFDIDEEVDDVAAVLDFLKRKGLLVEVSEDEISLPGAVQRIGSKTQSAVRKARQRARQKEESSVTMSRQNVTLSQSSHVEKRREEIEKRRERDREEKEIESEEDIDKTSSSADNPISEISNYYQQEIGVLSPNQYQQLIEYLTDDNMEVEVIKTAITKAADNSKRSFGYVNSILRNWRQNGITTMAKVKDEQRNYQIKKGYSHPHHSEPTSYEDWRPTADNPF